MSRSLSNLVIALMLIVITAFLLFLIKFAFDLFSGLAQIAMILAGMTTMASFTALQRFLDGDQRSPLFRIAFNETFLTESLLKGQKGSNSSKDAGRKALLPPPPWDLKASQLVGSNNALALASLRIDIEKELRRIAHENGIDLSTRPVGITHLARELIAREALPESLFSPLQELMAICNRAIHGEEIPGDVTAGVVRVGGQLLEQLRLLSPPPPAPSPAPPS